MLPPWDKMRQYRRMYNESQTAIGAGARGLDTAVDRQSEVEQQMRIIEHEINQLQQITTEIAEQLTPISTLNRPSPATPPEPQGKSPEVMLVPHAESLRSFARRISGINADLHRLLKSIEI